MSSRLSDIAPASAHASWEIGKIYAIHVRTAIVVGRLIAVADHELVLKDAAWIEETDWFFDAPNESWLSKIEAFPKERQIIVGRSSVVSAISVPNFSSPR